MVLACIHNTYLQDIYTITHAFSICLVMMQTIILVSGNHQVPLIDVSSTLILACSVPYLWPGWLITHSLMQAQGGSELPPTYQKFMSMFGFLSLDVFTVFPVTYVLFSERGFVHIGASNDMIRA